MDQFKYVIFNDANWDWRTFNLEKDMALAEKFDGGKLTDAVNPDLSKFKQHGGKLLMYHGWGDGNVPPMSTINYLKSVQSKMGSASQTDSWVRLFMVPAMAHCGGGEGPNQFDMVSALEQWVEKGKAPAQIVASRVITVAEGEVTRTRPLCPYPQVGQYKGSGSTDDAANFVCK
jgi:feruloyl esterase